MNNNCYAQWTTYGLPCPSTPYRYQEDIGLLRAKYGAGYAEQRRKFAVSPQTFDLVFDVSAGTLQTMSQFVDTYGYDWFTMPLVSDASGVPEKTDHQVRAISNLGVSALGFNRYRVVFSVECYVTRDQMWTGPV